MAKCCIYRHRWGFPTKVHRNRGKSQSSIKSIETGIIFIGWKKILMCLFYKKVFNHTFYLDWTCYFNFSKLMWPFFEYIINMVYRYISLIFNYDAWRKNIVLLEVEGSLFVSPSLLASQLLLFLPTSSNIKYHYSKIM